jgi:hypothetical protein
MSVSTQLPPQVGATKVGELQRRVSVLVLQSTGAKAIRENLADYKSEMTVCQTKWNIYSAMNNLIPTERGTEKPPKYPL